MITFKLSKVEFIQQSFGYASSIKIQISNIGNDECSSIPWDEFQVKYTSMIFLFADYIQYAILIIK